MGNQDHRHAALGHQIGDQVEDLPLDGDVERGGRLVRNQQIRLAGQRHGDGDALALAAGKLVRVGVDPLGGIGKADAIEQCNRLVARLRGRKALVPAQRLGDLAADVCIGLSAVIGS